MKAYMDEHECDKAHYQLAIKDPAECPKDAPKRKAGLIAKRPCDPEEIDEELTKLQARIAELEKKASNESEAD